MESPIDAIQARHRRELRELQGRITNKKKNATKKTRKGINEECAQMEREMKEKHTAELWAAEGGQDDTTEEEDQDQDVDSVDKVTAQLEDASLSPPPPQPLSQPQSPPQSQEASRPKKNRQKDRLARRAAAQEQLQRDAAAEAATMVDHAAVERGALAPLIRKSGRVEHVIRPDGHCLFSAVADQMGEIGHALTRASEPSSRETSAGEDQNLDDYRVVRHAAARYMQDHADDFAPFLAAYYADEEGAEAAPDLATHVAQIRDTAAWGGQLELQALASTYGVAIRVLHDGREETIHPAGGERSNESTEAERPMLWLVYYRHGFGLGEHYNSLRLPKK